MNQRYPLLAGSGIRIKILQNSASAVPSISTAIGAEGIYAKGSKQAVIVETSAEFVEALVSHTKARACLSIGTKGQRGYFE